MEQEEDREYYTSQIMEDGTIISNDFIPHVVAVLLSLPYGDLTRLAETNVRLFAINGCWGRVIDRVDFPGPILYLSPELLARPEYEIRGTIAHEFAHLVLGHSAAKMHALLVFRWKGKPTDWLNRGVSRFHVL